MSKYAYVKNSDDSVFKIVDYDQFDASKVAHKFGPGKEYRIVPVVRLADPPISNPATTRLGPVATSVESDRVTRQRTVVAIPQAEQDAASEIAQIKAVALDLKNGVGTSAQRIQRVERAVYRLLKEIYGD